MYRRLFGWMPVTLSQSCEKPWRLRTWRGIRRPSKSCSSCSRLHRVSVLHLLVLV